MLIRFIKNKVNAILRQLIINPRNRLRLKNKAMTILANNCNGGFILHDLNQPFNSPFVNLYLEPNDFIRYVKDINYYNKQELVFISENYPFPVAYLGDIKIYFMHYTSEQEAQEKWQIRSQRINLNNLFIILTARDNYSEQDLKEFDELPYRNKVVLTLGECSQIQSAFYIKGLENHHSGDIFLYSGWSGKRYYDQFDYVSWFNENKNTTI